MNTTRAELYHKLGKAAASIARELPEVRLLVFGSLIRTVAWPSDVDVLVIYKKAEEVSRIRALLGSLNHDMPLHLLFLSTDEEAELKFVESEGCITALVSPLSYMKSRNW